MGKIKLWVFFLFLMVGCDYDEFQLTKLKGNVYILHNKITNTNVIGEKNGSDDYFTLIRENVVAWKICDDTIFIKQIDRDDVTKFYKIDRFSKTQSIAENEFNLCNDK